MNQQVEFSPEQSTDMLTISVQTLCVAERGGKTVTFHRHVTRFSHAKSNHTVLSAGFSYLSSNKHNMKTQHTQKRDSWDGGHMHSTGRIMDCELTGTDSKSCHDGLFQKFESECLDD